MKNKYFHLIFALLMVLAFNSCFLLTPEYLVQIRFQNLSTINGEGFNIGYGVKYGDAIHDASLEFGRTSEYYSIAEGQYSIMFKTIYGDWISATSYAIPSPDENGKYTISILGDWNYGIYFDSTRDE